MNKPIHAWNHAGLTCEIWPAGFFGTGYCGYVGVLPGHPMHGKQGNHLVVHGGLTIVSPHPDGYWWFGWDSGHDFSESKHRTLEFMIAETNRLAEQIKA